MKWQAELEFYAPFSFTWAWVSYEDQLKYAEV